MTSKPLFRRVFGERTFLCVLLLVFGLLSVRADSFVGISANLDLPQGSSSLRRLGGAGLRAGTYLSDNCAFEGTAASAENSAMLGADILVHWSAWSLYDRFFGFSAIDPFLTVGARGWIGESCGQVGPSASLGTFYHLDDHWSLRAEAACTLGLDTDVETVYTLSAGFQYAF